MKILVVLLLLGVCSINAQLDATAHGPALDAVHRALHDKCIKEHPVTDDDISKVRAGHFDDNDQQMKGYILCLWRSSGLIDLSTFRLSKILLDVYVPKVMNKGKGVNMYLECTAKARQLPGGTPLQERTWVLMKCTYETDPENFLMY